MLQFRSVTAQPRGTRLVNGEAGRNVNGVNYDDGEQYSRLAGRPR